MKTYSCAAWSACIVVALSGCGGSGGGGGPTAGTGSGTGVGTTTGATAPGGNPEVAPTPVVTPAPTTPPVVTASFPLRAAYGARLVAGYDDVYTVSGSCAGTARSKAARAQPTVFEGMPAFAQQLVASARFTNCTPAETVDPGTSYFDARTGVEFTPLGFAAVDAYGVVATMPVLPDSVKVGDSGDIASFAVYRDATKGQSAGRRLLSYVVEADTSAGATSATTAIVNFVTRGYNSQDAINYTEQARLRINTVGVLTAVSGDIVYANGARLVLTR